MGKRTLVIDCIHMSQWSLHVKDIKCKPVATEPTHTQESILAARNEENNRERGCGEQWSKLLKPSEAGRVPAVVHKSLNVADSLEKSASVLSLLTSSLPVCSISALMYNKNELQVSLIQLLSLIKKESKEWHSRLLLGNNKAPPWTVHKPTINIFNDIQKIDASGCSVRPRASAQQKIRRGKWKRRKDTAAEIHLCMKSSSPTQGHTLLRSNGT